MKRPVLVLFLLIVAVFGFGFYRGWFHVDKQTIERDENAAKAAVHNLEQKIEGKTSNTSNLVKEKK